MENTAQAWEPSAPEVNKESDTVSFMVERDITIALTEKEVAELGTEAAMLDEEIDKIEAEKKLAVDGFNKKIAQADRSMREKLLAIRTGKVTRHMMVKEVKDYPQAEVRVYYGPNYDILAEKRQMQGDEFQQNLFIRGKSEEKEAGQQLDAAPSDPALDLRDVIREETNSKTKHSSVDGPLQ